MGFFLDLHEVGVIVLGKQVLDELGLTLFRLLDGALVLEEHCLLVDLVLHAHLRKSLVHGGLVLGGVGSRGNDHELFALHGTERSLSWHLFVIVMSLASLDAFLLLLHGNLVLIGQVLGAFTPAAQG